MDVSRQEDDEGQQGKVSQASPQARQEDIQEIRQERR